MKIQKGTLGTLALVLLILLGCKETQVPDIYVPALKSFYDDKDFHAQALDPYKIEGDLIGLFWVAQSNYSRFTVGVSLYSENQGSQVTIKNITVEGVNSLYSGTDTITTHETVKNTDLYVASKRYSVSLEYDTFKRLHGETENVTATLTVERNGIKTTLRYPITIGTRIIAAPIR